MKRDAGAIERRIGALSPERRRALEQLLKQKGAEVRRLPLTPRPPGVEAIPLSFAQQRLWLLDRMEAGAAYNVPWALRLSGALDRSALEASLNEIVRRHEVLHTTFESVDGQPVQVIESAPRLEMQVADLGGLDGAERDSAARSLFRQQAERSFDLTRGPLVSATLVVVGPDEHLLHVCFHHIVFDGWSVAVFKRELSTLYAAYAAGRPSPLDELAIQYADFAWWQRQWLQGEVLERQLGYWRRRLEGVTHLELPADHPRPVVRTNRGAQHVVVFPTELVRRLREVCRTEGGTLFMLLLAGFKVLLSRYAGQLDVAVGSPIANRPDRSLEALIGFFVNSLVLRTDLSGDPTFKELLGRVRETALEAYDHQDLPFEKLVEELKPERDPSHNPFFEVVFAVQNAPREALELPGLTLRSLPMQATSTRFDLEVLIWETAEQLTSVFLYNADLFDAATIEAVGRHYVALLEAAATRPGARLSDLPLLGTAEKRRVLGYSAGRPTDYPRESTVHEQFEAQAARIPDATAVAFGEQRLTYGELDSRANQLAHRLQKLGVGPDDRVGVCMQRPPELVVALLGILKSGGAYLPLDPDYPTERLSFMIEDSQPAVVLTQERLLGRLPEHGSRVLCLDRDERAIAGESEFRPRAEVTAEHLAYVTYTSGSTGRPKGVEVRHRGVLRLLLGADYCRLGGGRTLLQLAPVSFDASTLEIWGPLLHGGRCIVYPERIPTAGELGEVLRREEVDTLWLTAALFNAVVDEAPQVLRPVRQLLIGGEALSVDHVRRAQRELPETQIINGYGPTESTTFTCCYPIPRPLDDVQSIPIGGPIANTEVYVLDDWLKPVPVGVPGELYVGGDGLARGYLNRPGLTAERFIPSPFPGEPGARLYRTGDRVRWRRDGTIEFMGRLDFQVKIRGFRIELSEVEATLREHPAVRDAAVVARGAGHELQLAAYVAAETDAASLRQHLRDRVPEHMVPAAIAVLDELPLTSHGKVDRDALPAPQEDRPLDEVFVSPAGGPQERIAAIWRELLGHERVGARDNFFDLGGHSVLVIRLQTRLKEELGVDVPIAELFRSPTIESLARRIGQDQAVGSGLLEDARTRAGARRTASGDRAGIAIVGMSGRFPGAESVEAFWSLLRGGVEAITFFDEDELREAGVPEDLLGNPHFVRAHGAVAHQELFDASFFGYSPRQAELIDPQQRLFLECAWEALERAGYDPRRYQGLIGVYAGSSANSYQANLQSRRDLVASAGGLQLGMSSAKDFLATRVSYKLDLRGPSVTIQTACSTSLVAVHAACQSLLDRECDIALAGGASIRVPWKRGYLYQEEGIASPDGHCRAFDAKAQGTTIGDGVGIVALKRLDEAVADRDPIHAVIRGTAINNDGSAKVGYTAPSVEGQARVIALALAAADVEPDSIGYLEAHGTGTALGDPVEVAALADVFRPLASEPGSCALGAVKANVGHLDAAAGVAGLIKTSLCVEHGELPPTPHFERLNPKIDLGRTPFFVNDQLRPWPSTRTPRRAGVSSFGVGGTNAHAVLEQAPPLAASGPSRGYKILTLSARSPEALDQASRDLAAHLRDQPARNLADVAYTLQVGRSAFEWRRAVVCESVDGAVAALDDSGPERLAEGGPVVDPPPSVVFAFPGQGTQHVHMARRLYSQERVFREVISECADRFEAELGFDLRGLLYPDTADTESEAAELSRRLAETSAAQAALFSVELALARLLMSWGITPAACIGHSIGEYVAACLAGVMSLEDAARVVARRGRLMAATPPGVMLAVPLREEELVSELREGVWLAAVNAPELCVASGDEAEIAALEQRLQARGVEGRRLVTSHAFHSPRMESAIGPLVREIGAIELHRPRIPFVSNVTGDWITDSQATDPAYWGEHLRRTVRYADGVRTLLAESARVLLEVGPGRALTGLSELQVERGGPHRAIACLRRPQGAQDDHETLLGALGRLWTSGVTVDWEAFSSDETRSRVRLPTYPFERQRFWIDRRPRVRDAAADDLKPGGEQEERLDSERWFYVPSWRRTPPPTPDAEARSRWCVFDDGSWLGSSLIARLRELGHDVAVVEPGPGFVCEKASRYRIGPTQRSDYEALIGALSGSGERPSTIVHLWGTRPDAGVDLTYRSLILLAQALGGEETGPSTRLIVVTTGLQEVFEGDSVTPEKATVTGPCRVIPQEYPDLECRSVDVSIPKAGSAEGATLVDRLIAESRSDDTDGFVAYRAGHRWAQHLEPMVLRRGLETGEGLRSRGVYLITGGLTGVGYALAEHFARTVAARLILVGRTTLPERNEWDAWLDGHEPSDHTSKRIRNVRKLEELGAEVLPLSADVADTAQAEAAVARALDRFGTIHGVVHSAGVPGGRMIPVCDAEGVQQVLAPKVAGTVNLDALLADVPLDFMVLCSSLAAVFGGVGRVEYCAANAFLDAFAKSRTAATGRRTVAINWDSWSEIGMAVDASLPAHLETARTAVEENLHRGLRSAEGVTVFQRALASGQPHVLVSTSDLPRRIERTQRAKALTMPTASTTARRPRPTLQSVYQPPRTETERKLAELWQEYLGVEQVGAHDNFFELGGDSVVGIQLVAKASRAGLRLKVGQIFEHPTVAELASVAGRHSGADEEQGPVVGSVPLSPIQHWFFDQDPPRPGHFNLARMFETTRPIDRSALERAARAVFEHHDALRFRYRRQGRGWEQWCEPPSQVPALETFDYSALPDEEARAAVERTAAELQASFDLEHGPMVYFVYFDLGPGRPGRLLFAAHHLLMDVVSMRVVMEDLQSAYEQVTDARPISLPPKTTSFKRWTEQLRLLASSEVLGREAAYWLSRPWERAAPIPADQPEQENTNQSVRALGARLDAGETRVLLQELPARLDARVEDLLLYALARSVGTWSGATSVLVNLEHHGREAPIDGVDPSRTVGWFTALVPVLLDLGGGSDALSTLALVKEQLRSLPGRGLGYGLLRHLSRDESLRDRLRALPSPELSFLYLGSLDRAQSPEGWLRPASEATGPPSDAALPRAHVLEVSSAVIEGELHVNWIYSEGLHARSTIETVADGFLRSLRELIDVDPPLAQADARSDFAAELSASDMEALMGEIDGPAS